MLCTPVCPQRDARGSRYCFFNNDMGFHFLKFRPDNFTDHVRTPWAGTRIARALKSGLGLNLPPRIGESWEFSTSAELPSHCQDVYDGTFASFLRSHADEWLSDAHKLAWEKQSPLLVKYLDAAYDLSVQLHPPIETPDLPNNHSGKWESWLILANDPQAGIYLGIKPGITKGEFIDAVRSNRTLKPLLHFVPVHVGELYIIPPCTIHALGAGICALEPQLMQPGKIAVSYRLHDWNRLYDAHGNLTNIGKPRQLHIDESLRFIDFDAPRGEELEKRCRILPEILIDNGRMRVAQFSQKPCLIARVISGSGVWEDDRPQELTFISVMQGHAEINIDGTPYLMKTGESGAIAACAQTIKITATNARIYMAHCLPHHYSECAAGYL